MSLGFFKKLTMDVQVKNQIENVYQCFDQFEIQSCGDLLNKIDELRLLEQKIFHLQCPHHAMQSWIDAWPLDKLSPTHFKNEEWLKEVQSTPHAARLYQAPLKTC